jgi:hypothetical protein
VLEDTITEAAAIAVRDPIDVIGSLPNLTFTQKDAAIYKVVNGEFRPGDRASDVWGLYNIVNEIVRLKSRSALASANRDFNLLEEITFLAQMQERAA